MNYFEEACNTVTQLVWHFYTTNFVPYVTIKILFFVVKNHQFLD